MALKMLDLGVVRADFRSERDRQVIYEGGEIGSLAIFAKFKCCL